MELLFDTETAGLPRMQNRKFPPPDDLASYESARLVSIAWLLTDPVTKEVVQQEYYIVKPSDFVISPESTAIHGISHDFADQTGHDVQFVFDRFITALKRASKLVAYNIEFDYNIMKSEFIRHNLSTDSIEIPKQCAMLQAQKHMKLQYFPKLADTYRYLFHERIRDAHNAMGDTLSLYKCYKEMCHREQQQNF